MSAKIVCLLAPKTIEPVLFWMVDKPIASCVCDALAGDGAAHCCIWKARLLNDSAYRERLALILPNAVRQLRIVGTRIYAGIDVNARIVWQRCFEFCKWRDSVLHV